MSAHDLDTECFFVTPIGEAGSKIRRQSDQVGKHIIGPAAEHVGLTVLRADELAEPGQISHQVIEHVCKASAVVADLTGSNANVYYELALRHAVKKPLVLIAHHEQMPKLAFDVAAERVIPYDHTDLDRVAEVIEELKKQLRAALDGPIKSPVSIALNLGALEGGDPRDEVLADLSGRMDGMTQAVRDLSARIPMSGEEILRSKVASRTVLLTPEVLFGGSEVREISPGTFSWSFIEDGIGEIEVQARIANGSADVRYVCDSGGRGVIQTRTPTKEAIELAVVRALREPDF